MTSRPNATDTATHNSAEIVFTTGGFDGAGHGGTETVVVHQLVLVSGQAGLRIVGVKLRTHTGVQVGSSMSPALIYALFVHQAC
jgi:hypothetical protein